MRCFEVLLALSFVAMSSGRRLSKNEWGKMWGKNKQSVTSIAETHAIRACLIIEAGQFESDKQTGVTQAIYNVWEMEGVIEAGGLGKNRKKQYAKAIKKGNSKVKDLGFDLEAKEEECKKKMNKNATAIFARSMSEMLVCETDKGVCKEQMGNVCPEGHSPQNKRGYNPAKAAIAFIPAQMAAAVGTAAIGALGGIGFVAVTAGTAGLATPAMVATAAAAGVAAQAPIPCDTAIALGLAALYGTEKKQCKCFPEECYFNVATATCQVAVGKDAQGTSLNPFKWLPYPGSKCMPKPGSENMFEPQCQLEPCEAADYSGSTNVDGVFGSAGVMAGSVLNCLSSDGSVVNNMAAASHLPNGMNNTVENRMALYYELGVNTMAMQLGMMENQQE